MAVAGWALAGCGCCLRLARPWAKVTSCLLGRIPELEAGAAQRLAGREDGDLLEDLVLVVGALQVVVGDAGAQVVDVVEADVAGEELEGLRELQVAAAAQRRLRVVPGVAVLPVDVLELVLDEEEPDAGGAGDDDSGASISRTACQPKAKTGDGRPSRRRPALVSRMLLRSLPGFEPAQTRGPISSDQIGPTPNMTERVAEQPVAEPRPPGLRVVLLDGPGRHVAGPATIEVAGRRRDGSAWWWRQFVKHWNVSRPKIRPPQRLARRDAKNEPWVQSWKRMNVRSRKPAVGDRDQQDEPVGDVESHVHERPEGQERHDRGEDVEYRAARRRGARRAPWPHASKDRSRRSGSSRHASWSRAWRVWPRRIDAMRIGRNALVAVDDASRTGLPARDGERPRRRTLYARTKGNPDPGLRFRLELCDDARTALPCRSRAAQPREGAIDR